MSASAEPPPTPGLRRRKRRKLLVGVLLLFGILSAAVALLILIRDGFLPDDPPPVPSDVVAVLGQPSNQKIKVSCASFSPSGNRIATSGWDNIIRVWDTNTFRQAFALNVGGWHQQVSSLAFSRDGTTLAACQSRGVLLWDVTTNPPREVATLIKSPERKKGMYGFVEVHFSPKEDVLVVTAGHGFSETTIWNLKEELAREKRLFLDVGGENVRHLPEPIEVEFLAFGQAKRILVRDKDRLVWLDTGTMKPIEEKQFQVPKGIQTPIALAPDHRRLAFVTGAVETGYTLWDLENEPPKELATINVGGAIAMAISPDGQTIATCGGDSIKRSRWHVAVPSGFVRLWDLATGEKLHEWRFPPTAAYNIAFAPDGRYLACPNSDGTVYMIHLNNLPRGR